MTRVQILVNCVFILSLHYLEYRRDHFLFIWLVLGHAIISIGNTILPVQDIYVAKVCAAFTLGTILWATILVLFGAALYRFLLPTLFFSFLNINFFFISQARLINNIYLHTLYNTLLHYIKI